MLVLVLAAGLGGTVPRAARADVRASASATLQEAKRFRAFGVYNFGPASGRIPLTDILFERPRVPRRSMWSFIYGDCTAQGEEGCSPPFEVQNYDACRRNLASYRPSEPGFPSPTYSITRIRGVPVALFSDDARAEVYTGRTTVVIFARSISSARGSIRRLRAVNRRLTPVGASLPPPVAGALQGRLRC
jgi:hypothetical protein